MNSRTAALSKARRLELAAHKVEDEGWTQGKAAEFYGVSRGRVNVYVKELREKRAEPEPEPTIRVENEHRRVGTFAEFDERYFGRWICPDCSVHHPTPDFHQEIIDAVEGPDKRVLINVPPYHAKSTLVTVKHSIFNLVRNPNSRRIVVSKSLPFARTFLHSIDQLLTNPDLYEGGPSLIDDWGPFKTDDKAQVWNKDQIYVAGRVTAEKDPTLQVIGVGGQIYGRRSDDIVFDDIADEKNQANPDQVDKMREWIDKMALSRIGRNGKARFVGTRVGAGDIYSILRIRDGYKVIGYPCIVHEDDESGDTLWPDHFPYEDAVTRRTEMKESDWQLVYQNVDVPGLGASFTEEMLEACKDFERTLGHYEKNWRLVMGLDLAGGSKDSGFTAGMVKGVDLATGRRFHVDCFNEKSMKAPRLKDEIFSMADAYPIDELRVESNGLQSQIVQYNEEIIRELALRGVRVVPHNTGSNKWDAQFGVEASAPLFSGGLQSIPWGNAPTAKKFGEYVAQMIGFPMAVRSDLAMADWFAELAIKDLLKRAHLPLFDSRMHVPDRVKKKRVVVDFGERQVRRIPIRDQGAGRGRSTIISGSRRRTLGRPMQHGEPLPPEPVDREFVNIEGSPDQPRDG